MRYLIIILTAILFSGCYNAQKATEQVNKADSKFPEIIAKLARDKYPCTDLLKNDTAVIYKDTLVYIECPDTSVTNNNPFEVLRTDTVNKVITKTIRVPVTLPIRTQVITKWFEDSAKLKLAALSMDKITKENQQLQTDLKAIQGKLKTRTKYLWWLLALCIGLTVWNFRKLFI